MIPKEELEAMYIGRRMSTSEIGHELGRADNTIWYWLKECGIPTRTLSESLMGHSVSPEARRKISENHADFSGSKNGNWKGGRPDTGDGYIKIKRPDHPNATQAGYVLEHRMVMSDHLSRKLLPDEVVHHKNGNKKDNRLCNLEIKLKPSHDALHYVLRRIQRRRSLKGTFI